MPGHRHFHQLDVPNLQFHEVRITLDDPEQEGASDSALLSWGGETGISQAHSGVFIEPAGANVLVQTALISLCFLINHFLGGGKRGHLYPSYVTVSVCSPAPPGAVISPSPDESDKCLRCITVFHFGT